MARYIDADEYLKYCEENWIPLNEDAVKVQPTVDVAPVKHAYWKEELSYMEEDGSEEYQITCANCNELYTIMDWQRGKYRYCPNCGAKMEGKEN